jgi:hypothetical protein
MKQTRIVPLAVLMFTVAICGQQVPNGSSSPARTSFYAQPGKLIAANGSRLGQNSSPQRRDKSKRGSK